MTLFLHKSLHYYQTTMIKLCRENTRTGEISQVNTIHYFFWQWWSSFANTIFTNLLTTEHSSRSCSI